MPSDGDAAATGSSLTRSIDYCDDIDVVALALTAATTILLTAELTDANGTAGITRSTSRQRVPARTS